MDNEAKATVPNTECVYNMFLCYSAMGCRLLSQRDMEFDDEH